MSREPRMSCARMRVLIEPHLDGTLAPRWRPGVELHLAGCADCRAEVQAAHQLRQALQRLPSLEFPQHRLAAVLAEVRREEAVRAGAASPADVWSRLRRRLAGWIEPGAAGPAWRAALATSAVVVAALAVLLVVRQHEPARPSQAELARAERDALLALAYVIQVTHETSHDVLSVAVADVVNGVSRVENVIGNVGVVVTERAAQPIVEPLSYPVRRMERRQQPPRPAARVDTTQQEERQ